MVLSTASAKELAILQRLVQSGRQIQEATKHAVSRIDPFPNYVSSTALLFPSLADLVPDLRALGLSDCDASRLMELFRSACLQLQTLFQTEFSKMLACSSPQHHDTLQACLLRMYTQKSTALQVDLLQHAKAHHDRVRQLSRLKKPSFNHDYVPVLEKYFEYNAYPSAADRILMARKSMMTERQIEVWFQNHRNRSRKDGKPLARLRSSDPLPKDMSFDSLDTTMGDLLRPESERMVMEQQESGDEDSDGIEALASSLGAASSSRAGSVEGEVETQAPTEQPTQQPTSNPLNPSTPPFAYPAPYVPPFRSFLDATTQPTSFTFPNPTWTRHSSTIARTSTHITRRDIDAFADLFARLNVREAPKKQGRRKIAPLPQSRSSPVPQPRYTSPAATCAITTILCPGRHPAFVPSVAPRATRRARSSPSPPPYESWMSSPGAGPSKPSTSTTSASSTAFTFQSPPQYSQSAAPTSPPANASPKASTPTPRRRKSPQLPRRVPGSPPVARPYSQTQNQTTSHPTPQRSPRPSHHPYASPSRASSSAPSSSSHRVSSSSSSSASSSAPTTPNGSTMSLPMSYPMNTPKNTKPTSPVFTAQNIVDIFGDAAAFTTPSSQGFSGFGTAGFDSPDFGRMPMGNMFDFNFNTSHGPSIVQARS